MSANENAPGVEPGAEIQNQISEEKERTMTIVTPTIDTAEFQDWTAQVRDRIQALAITSTEDPEALTLLEETANGDPVHPLQLHSWFRSLQARGLASDVDLTLPAPPQHAAWAVDATVTAGTSGSVTITYQGRIHGPDGGPRVHLEQYVEAVVFPEESNDESEAGATFVQPIEITWDIEHTQDGTFTDPHSASIFAAALAEAAAELSRIEDETSPWSAASSWVVEALRGKEASARMNLVRAQTAYDDTRTIRAEAEEVVTEMGRVTDEPGAVGNSRVAEDDAWHALMLAQRRMSDALRAADGLTENSPEAVAYQAAVADENTAAIAYNAARAAREEAEATYSLYACSADRHRVLSGDTCVVCGATGVADAGSSSTGMGAQS